MLNINKYHKYSGFVLIILILFVSLKMVSYTYVEDTKMRLVIDSLQRFFVIMFIFYLINRLNLKDWIGFKRSVSSDNIYLLFIPYLFLFIILISNQQVYKVAGSRLTMLNLVYMLLIGFLEELSFRGLILPLFIKADAKHNIFKAVLLSSLLFSLMHYFNWYQQPDLDRVHGQVLLAFFMGIFLSGLFLKIQNIIPVAVFHALFNFVFGTDDLKRMSNQLVFSAPTREVGDPNIFGIVLTVAVILLLSITGMRMVVSSDKKALFEKLDKMILP